MKRARKVSNLHVEVHFKQKQRLTIVFYWKYTPPKKAPCKGAEYFIVDKTACHQHETVPKMNSPSVPPNK